MAAIEPKFLNVTGLLGSWHQDSWCEKCKVCQTLLCKVCQTLFSLAQPLLLNSIPNN